MLVVFSPIFVADTKTTFVYNFIASLEEHKYNFETDQLTYSKY